jgi:hypothetical protein
MAIAMGLTCSNSNVEEFYEEFAQNARELEAEGLLESSCTSGQARAAVLGDALTITSGCGGCTLDVQGPQKQLINDFER